MCVGDKDVCDRAVLYGIPPRGGSGALLCQLQGDESVNTECSMGGAEMEMRCFHTNPLKDRQEPCSKINSWRWA